MFPQYWLAGGAALNRTATAALKRDGGCGGRRGRRKKRAEEEVCGGRRGRRKKRTGKKFSRKKRVDVDERGVEALEGRFLT